ncbi:GNAT family N-acetyltransferase [Dactylosporangium sp. CA-152071]|uniref:GNAT family N-acetyltransferase n=1 Tax=Dactylosporangium sp. CA-152071 TaxID=3239933 RepID=UPI003D90747F
MLIEPLRADRLDDLVALMRLGAPYVTVRGASDYWLYAHLFAATCPVAVDGDTTDGRMVGAVIAMRSQVEPGTVYVQDVAVRPDHRRAGVARALLASVAAQARAWGCDRLTLTCAPGNAAALAAWTQLGFRNLPGDYTVDGIQVIRDFKGPGRDRPVFQLDLTPTDTDVRRTNNADQEEAMDR